MAYMMIKVNAPSLTTINMNDKIVESAKAHEGVVQLRNLMDAILAGAIDAEVTVAARNSDQEISPTVGPELPSGSPDLGTAKTFAALAGSGITNAGGIASVLTGNIGSFPTTSITGFPPATATGTTNIGTEQAKIDATAAYLDLTTRVVTATIASDLGGQTLTAGVYDFASGAATLAGSGNGTLTFSGSATDIFVIKTATSLGTGAGGIPTMTLTGGALASNIYWAVGSSATLNIGVTSASAVFKGTVIAYASVTNTQGGTVDGSLIALNGAVTYSNAASTPTLSNSTSSILPAASPGDANGSNSTYNHK